MLSSLSPTDPPPTHLSSLSLHDALPISCHPPIVTAQTPLRSREGYALQARGATGGRTKSGGCVWSNRSRSEEHTSELQSLRHLVCRLLLEKKKKNRQKHKPKQAKPEARK